MSVCMLTLANFVSVLGSHFLITLAAVALDRGGDVARLGLAHIPIIAHALGKLVIIIPPALRCAGHNQAIADSVGVLYAFCYD